MVENRQGVCWPVIDFSIRKPRGKVADGIPREGIWGLFSTFALFQKLIHLEENVWLIACAHGY